MPPPLDGMTPPPEGWDMNIGPQYPRQDRPRGIGGKIGGIFATLMGIKHAQDVAQKENAGNWALGTLHRAATEGGVSPEEQTAALKLVRGVFGDTAADIVEAHTKEAVKRIAAKQAKAQKDQEEWALLQASKKDQGPAPMPSAALQSPFLQSPTPPPAPVQTAPQTAPAQPPGAPAPAAVPPAAPSMPQGPYQNPSRIINAFPKPPIPFSQGAVQAGPAPNPPNPPVGRAQSAQGRDAGFGGATTAPMPAPTPEINPWTDFAQVGRNTLAKEAPGLQFRTNEAVRQAGAIMQQGIETRKAMIANDPQLKQEFDSMTARQKMTFLTTGNITPEPHFNIPGMTEAQEGDVDMNGKRVAPGTPGRRSNINGTWLFTPEQGKLIFKAKTNPDGSKSQQAFNSYTGKAVGDPTPMAPPVLTLKKITERDGTTKLAAVNTTTGQLGAPMDPRLFGVDPAFVQNVTTAGHINMVPQLDGTIVPVFSETTSTTQKGAGTTGTGGAGTFPPLPGEPVLPGYGGTPTPNAPATQPAAVTPAKPVTPVTPAATPAAGIGGGMARARITGQGQPVGSKGALTQGQRITFGQKQAAFNNTIDLVNSVKSKLPMLNSLLDAKRIQFQIDPQQGIIKALFNRALLSDKEAELAGDFASLMEHINTLRGPLGATGFRGHEAWGALQQQRGQLVANPKVTSRVLDNTLKALTDQRDILRNALGGKGAVPSWASSLPNVGFKDGKDEYHIPPDQVDRFMVAHPNATPLKE